MVVKREYRPTLVRADHDVCALDPRERVRDLLRQERLPLALDRGHVELRPVDDLVDEGRLAQRPNDDGDVGAAEGGGVRYERRRLGGRDVPERRLDPGDGLDVGGEVGRGALHARPFVRGQKDRSGLAAVHDRERRGRRLERDACVLADSQDAPCTSKQAKDGQCYPATSTHDADRQTGRPETAPSSRSPSFYAPELLHAPHTRWRRSTPETVPMTQR